jgi:hypothetical protein
MDHLLSKEKEKLCRGISKEAETPGNLWTRNILSGSEGATPSGWFFENRITDRDKREIVFPKSSKKRVTEEKTVQHS